MSGAQRNRENPYRFASLSGVKDLVNNDSKQQASANFHDPHDLPLRMAERFHDPHDLALRMAGRFLDLTLQQQHSRISFQSLVIQNAAG